MLFFISLRGDCSPNLLSFSKGWCFVVVSLWTQKLKAKIKDYILRCSPIYQIPTLLLYHLDYNTIIDYRLILLFCSQKIKSQFIKYLITWQIEKQIYNIGLFMNENSLEENVIITLFIKEENGCFIFDERKRNSSCLRTN